MSKRGAARLVSFIAVILTLPSQSAFSASVRVEEAFPKLTFEKPLDLQDPRDGTGRLFVVEQGGVIKVFKNSSQAEKAEIFLDIRDRVDFDENEQGLLGLAFDPNYKENGYFYVNYVAAEPLRTVLSRFQVSPENADDAAEDSEEKILEFSQPYSNHNGGQVSFGPDGFLYIATGDGGSAGDPHGNGQDRKSLLGKILRIDVSKRTEGLNYSIPADNPYAGNTSGYREEIYAYGLRNPWRFSWDGAGRLWAADVGQYRMEEIDLIEKGKNYGWNIMEGSLCFKPQDNCKKTGLEMPVGEYLSEEGRSVTGGFVYRGKRVPSLAGKYVFTDFVSGRLWTLSETSEGFRRELLLETKLNVSSFGEDAERELYLCSFDGKIYSLSPTPS